ncbi:hypothetical protein B5180_01555 [Streptomyces sp. BF-3]|nr:hypothetical protein B5180_01555 [Streptomyces sp. BF-3]
MELTIESIGTTVSVNLKEDREPWQRPATTPGVIYVDNGHGFECGPEEYTAQEARELAAALLKAADEADWSSGVNTFPEVLAGSLRVGDVLTPNTGYRGNDPEAGMVCESATHVNGPYMTVVWRDEANGETITSNLHEKEIVHLLRRGPEAGR